MSTQPPNQPPFDPNAPFDPTNTADPRYDRSRDPRFDPRWQKAQERMWRDQQRAQRNQGRAQSRAYAAMWKEQARAQRQSWKMYWRAQRRTSVVGPLLLISVGVVFYLLHIGRISSSGLVTWYSRWWPLLLIVIGLLRLAEWAIDRARLPEGAPAPRYSLGGGGVALIVFLAIAGLALHNGAEWHNDGHGIGFLKSTFSDSDVDHFFGEKHEEDAPLISRPAAVNGSLNIDNPHGDVTVTGTSDDGQIHLSVHKEVYTNSDSTATDRLRRLLPTLVGSPDNLSVHVPTVDGGLVNVTVVVPATTHVVLNSNRGDVRVTNMKTPLSVTANNGDVEVAAITGAVQLHVNGRHRSVNVHSVTGDVTVEGNGEEVSMTDITGAGRIQGDFYSGAHMQHVTGAVGYHSSRTDLAFSRLDGDFDIDGSDLTASNLVGPASISTRSRNITLDRVSGDVRIVNNHGDVEIHGAPPTGSVVVDSQNGNVEVTLPEKAKFNLQAETSDGDTHSNFSGLSNDGRGALTGAVNGGGAAVRLNTSHGDITVNGNQEGPLAAAPPAPRIVMPDVNAITRDALKTADDAVKEANAEVSGNKAQAQAALEEARQAVKQAQAKQREAEATAREAAKQK